MRQARNRIIMDQMYLYLCGLKCIWAEQLKFPKIPAIHKKVKTKWHKMANISIMRRIRNWRLLDEIYLYWLGFKWYQAKQLKFPKILALHKKWKPNDTKWPISPKWGEFETEDYWTKDTYIDEILNDIKQTNWNFREFWQFMKGWKWKGTKCQISPK